MMKVKIRLRMKMEDGICYYQQQIVNILVEWRPWKRSDERHEVNRLLGCSLGA